MSNLTLERCNSTGAGDGVSLARMWGFKGTLLGYTGLAHTGLGYIGLTLLAVGCCTCPNTKEAKAPDESPADESSAAASAETGTGATDHAPKDDNGPTGGDGTGAMNRAPADDTASAPADDNAGAMNRAPTEEKPEPHFTEGMSVNDAIKAVPPGTEYLSLDGDTLGKPLADLELYKPCKLNPSQHFKLRVAVWDGKAVGIDVTSANKKLAECVRQQVSQVQWHDKVKSINTVDYSY